MQYRSGSDIRETFLKFFESKGHRRVHSSSLVPANDPTLLFTNAGMNQFKDVFLGIERRDYTRATTAQKVVRAGGKHNDLENVGFTRRHHTFFEMLGNFSFGDYFKKDAIAYAWELVTSPEWFGIPKDKLYVTIFKGENGVPGTKRPTNCGARRVCLLNASTRWAARTTSGRWATRGPCGPCSEIFYDMGQEAGDDPAVDKPFGEDESRYVEIWNLVFMQFDRDAQGELHLLPKPSIDTGMGLERTAAVLQGVISNYETDLFTPLIQKASELTSIEYQDGIAPTDASLRIIADHARAATFLISDGVLPANEGRGYVLRKILRRGIRHGRLLGQEKPFMYQMVYAVRDEMAGAYPELKESADRVAKVVEAEERQFARVIEVGARHLDQEISLLLKQKESSRDAMRKQGHTRLAFTFQQVFPGKDAFHLYETYGLPLDFMVDAARDAGIEFDLTGFEKARAEEQARARASWKGGAKQSASPAFRALPKTEFEGYRTLKTEGSEVLAIVKDGVGVPAANAGDAVEVVLDHTSFYADSGGQIGDTGWLYSDDHNSVVADVSGCTKPVQGVFAHKAILRQSLALGDKVDTVVDADFRAATRRNHTGTHLLHAALREVLGTHVKQAGSLVEPARLRFDFLTLHIGCRRGTAGHRRSGQQRGAPKYSH